MNTAAVARQLCGGWSSTCCGWCKFCCLCTLTVIKVSNGKLISGCRKASWLTCSYCMVLRQVSTKSQDFQHVSHWQSPCRICFFACALPGLIPESDGKVPMESAIYRSLRFFFVVNKPCLPDIPLKKWLFRTGLVSDAFGKSAAVRSDLVIDSIT